MFINKLTVVDGKYLQQRTIRYKFCKDCKHFNKNGQSCRLFTSVNLVTGDEEPVKAVDARNIMHMCGHGGSAYEQLEKTKQPEEVIVSNVIFNYRP